jgi:molecular chaperone Hsp33
MRLTLVDVTMPAKALEARHLAGPTAALAMAEGLTAVALMSADLADADEAISLRMQVTGPVRGLLVEACGNGDLRGFPNQKILDAPDDAESIESRRALGEQGVAEIVRSVPGRTLNQASISAAPPLIERVLARYYNLSLQIPSAVALACRSDSGGILWARGAVAERMPDANSETFVQILEAFQDGRVHAALGEAATLDSLRPILPLPRITRRESRELRFRCRCSRAKIRDVMTTLSVAELDTIIESGQQRITCHMCGADYTLPADELRGIRDARRAKEDDRAGPIAD